MKKLLSIASLLLFTVSINAQETCGFDSVLATQRNYNPDFNDQLYQMNEALNYYIEDKNNNQTIQNISNTADYVIPVVVHVIRDPSDPIPVISYAQIESQIDALNIAYSNGYTSNNGPNAVDTKIQFCLAKIPAGPSNWTSSSEPGVMRYTDAARAHNQNTITSTDDLLTLTHPTSAYFPFNNYLNVWVVQSINGLCSGVQGYSILPLGPQVGINGFTIDGVVIRGDAFGDNSPGNSFTLQPHNQYGPGCVSSFAIRNEGKVLVHEVGHYLSLFHTFQPDIITGAVCAGSSPTTCMNEGDFICDTPPSNQTSTYLCGQPIPSSCGVPEMIENYMAYSYDPCQNTFTQDQTNRITAYLDLFRPELSSLQNQINTGIRGTGGCLPAELIADFSFSGNNCINTPITFNSVGAPANSATSFNWSFPGGSPSSSSSPNPSVTYTTPGNYTVVLTVDDGSGPVSSTQTIGISACQLNPDYIHNANWYYGQYASVDFTSGTPVATNTARVNQTVFSMEGTYSYSDDNGDLVFYTDGTNLWNNLHQQINSSPIFIYPPGGWPNSVTGQLQPTTSVNGICAIPYPNKLNEYLLFIAPGFNQINSGITSEVQWVHIDLNTNTITPAQDINQSGIAKAECLTIIPHCNGIDYWVVSHSTPGTNKFYSYLVSSLGINFTPVISSSFVYRTKDGSEMKGSPDNTSIVIAGGWAGNPSDKDVAIYSFDNITGIVSNEQIFDAPGFYQFTGCSFSPNGQQIYASTSWPQGVVQFDLNGNYTLINSGGNNSGYIQMGPDNNLYISKAFTSSNEDITARITNPDFPNNFGSYTVNAIDFSTIPPGGIKTLKSSIPHFIDGIQPDFTPADYTFAYNSCNEVDFTLDVCWEAYTATWNFGDGPTVATGSNVTHTYSLPGTYNVTCSLTLPGLSGSIDIQHTITILELTTSITGPTSVCLNNSNPSTYSVPYIAGSTYNWTISGNGTISGASNGSQIDVIWNSGIAGTVSVTITNGACSTSGTLNVTLNPQPTVTATANPTIICPPGSPVTLTASGATSYLWTYNSTSTSGNPITDNPNLNTTYTVTGTDNNGCQSSANADVIVETNCANVCTSCTDLGTTTLTSNPPAFQTYCVNNNLTISGNVNLIASEFKIAPNVTITVDPTSVLTITGSHLYACSDMWKGIVVQPGGRIIIQAISFGNFKRSSLIEDAFIAVDIQSNSTITNNPLIVNTATFNRNQIGIQITDYSTSSGAATYPIDIVNSVFTSRDLPFTPNSLNWPHTDNIKANNGITGLAAPYIDDVVYSSTNPNAYLKAPFISGASKPMAGIKLINVGSTLITTVASYHEIKIGKPGKPKFNLFDNLFISINASSSNLTSVNNVFQNTISVKKNPGVAINAIANNLTNNRLQVIPATKKNFSNRFYDCGAAINSVDYLENIATNCLVQSSWISTAPAPSPANYNGKYGFVVQSNRFLTVNFSENEMYNLENGIVFIGNYGPLQNGGSVINGQYSGQIDINNNTLGANLPGDPVTTQYMANAITVSNVLGSGLINAPGAILNVNDNTINNVYRGIGISTWTKKDVKTNNNIISLAQDAFAASPLQYGIAHQANSAYSQYGNTIINNNVSGFGIGANDKVRAIVTALCGHQEVRCNRVSKTYKGIEFNGDNGSTIFVHNDMTNHRYGMVLDNAGFIGVQGDATNPSENRWLGTWNAPNFKTATLATATASTAVGSELWIRNSPAAYNPNGFGFTAGINGQDDYFYNGSVNSTLKYITNNPLLVNCPVVVCCKGQAKQIARMEQIVQDLDPLVNNVAATRYINKNKVYRILRDNPDLLNASSLLQDFYFEKNMSNTETIAKVEDDFMLRDIVSGEAKVSSIIAENSVEQNYLTFFNSYVKQQTDTITPTDSLVLVNLAMGCPFTEGTVIYQARALYNSIYRSNVIFEDNCSSENARLSRFSEDVTQSSTEFSNLKVILYPNPSTGMIYLNLDDDSSDHVKVSVQDVRGKVIYASDELKVINGLCNFKLDVENGVYFVKVTSSETNKISIKKIIIQH